MYKIETHLHTVYSSSCGHLDADAIVNGYLKAGYHGVAVTDHFNWSTYRFLGFDRLKPEEISKVFLEGYYRVREVGERLGLKVYKGAEFRFDGSDNDYLVFGFSDDMLREPAGLFKDGLSDFSRRCRSEGGLIIQAHPYRNVCTPAEAALLDGVEVLNRNIDWDNHNDWALAFAEKNGLLQTSGSDCHTSGQIGKGGIISRMLPENDGEFIALLRSRDYTMI